LKKLIQVNPSVALYKAVLLKVLKKEGDAEFNEVLKRTALHVPDRKYLYHFIHGKEERSIAFDFVEEEIPTTEIIEPIEVKAKEIESAISISEEKPTKPKKEKKTSTEEKPKKVKKEKASIEIDVQSIEEEPVVKLTSQSLVEKVTILPEIKEVEKVEIAQPEVAALPLEHVQEEHTFEDWLNFLEGHQIEEKEALLNNQIDRHIAAASYEVELKEEIKELETEEEGEMALSEVASQKVTALAKDSITFTTGAITETLAKIMLMQGKINESIAMYEQLGLKYPEKSNYFAAQIELIKKK
jgi:hypothetical protein